MTVFLSADGFAVSSWFEIKYRGDRHPFRTGFALDDFQRSVPGLSLAAVCASFALAFGLRSWRPKSIRPRALEQARNRMVDEEVIGAGDQELQRDPIDANHSAA